MSRSKKIIGGAALIAAAMIVRTIVRVWRARHQRAPEPLEPVGRGTGVVSSAPGAHFPQGGPQPLQNEEGAPSRADLDDLTLGPPNAQPAPGRDTNPV
jgi:hypothetical protein